MNTRNEAVQKYLTEGLKAARATGMSPLTEDSYCAAYLAQKLAHLERDNAMAYTQPERDRLADWAFANPVYAREAISDLTDEKLAELFRAGEATLGDYLMGKAQAAMIDDLEGQDAEPCHIAEDDLRASLRDYKVEEMGVW
jgi:hypothetical protein